MISVHDHLLRGVRDRQPELLGSQALHQAFQHQVHHACDFRLGKRLVIDDLVQTVQELGAEGRFQQSVHLGAGLGADLSVFDAVQDIVGAQIRRQDDDGIFKVHRPALTVRNTSIIQYLQ